MGTTDYDRYGQWAVCNPDSDEPTISPMKNPNDIVVGMTADEARDVMRDLDDALEAIV